MIRCAEIGGRSGRRRKTHPSQWSVVKNAFESIVDEATFDAAQQRCGGFTRKKSDQQLLDNLRGLLSEKEYLSLDLLRKSVEAAPPQTYLARFGSIGNAYNLIGYKLSPATSFRQHLVSIRDQLIHFNFRYFALRLGL